MFVLVLVFWCFGVFGVFVCVGALTCWCAVFCWCGRVDMLMLTLTSVTFFNCVSISRPKLCVFSSEETKSTFTSPQVEDPAPSPVETAMDTTENMEITASDEGQHSADSPTVNSFDNNSQEDLLIEDRTVSELRTEEFSEQAAAVPQQTSQFATNANSALEKDFGNFVSMDTSPIGFGVPGQLLCCCWYCMFGVLVCWSCVSVCLLVSVCWSVCFMFVGMFSPAVFVACCVRWSACWYVLLLCLLHAVFADLLVGLLFAACLLICLLVCFLVFLLVCSFVCLFCFLVCLLFICCCVCWYVCWSVLLLCLSHAVFVGLLVGQFVGLVCCSVRCLFVGLFIGWSVCWFVWWCVVSGDDVFAWSVCWSVRLSVVGVGLFVCLFDGCWSIRLFMFVSMFVRLFVALFVDLFAGMFVACLVVVGLCWSVIGLLFLLLCWPVCCCWCLLVSWQSVWLSVSRLLFNEFVVFGDVLICLFGMLLFMLSADIHNATAATRTDRRIHVTDT